MIVNEYKGFTVTHTNSTDGNINSASAFAGLIRPNASQTKIIEANQVHDTKIAVVTDQTPHLSKVSQTDGLITADKQIMLLIKTADCIPAVFYDAQNQIVAAIHAGWRGLSKDFPAITLRYLMQNYQSNPQFINVYIGPAIRSCCYLFQDKPVQAEMSQWQPHLTFNQGIWHIDLVGFFKSTLVSMGIDRNNITDSNICTKHDHNWYSYFRHKQTGEPYGTNTTVVQLK